MNKNKIEHHLELARVNLNAAIEEIRKGCSDDWSEGYEDGWMEAAQFLLSQTKKRTL